MRQLEFRLPRQTLAQWLRQMPPERLERGELARLERDRCWRREHPHQVAELEAYYGKLVRLDRERPTLDPDIRYPAGHPFYVFDVFAGDLHAVTATVHRPGKKPLRAAIVLQPRWITLDTSTPFTVVSFTGGRARGAEEPD